MLNQSTPAPVSGGFDTLNLISPICRAVKEEKYSTPTPIQVQAIPPLLLGRDLLGCAQTGTGKTAAFALPILQRLAEKKTKVGPKQVRALILTPTRELAAQIDDSFRVYGRYMKFKKAVIYGGVRPKPQINNLRNGVDVLVATPGRLLDLFEQRCLRLDQIDVIVLDEADRMLDMGFLPDVKKIIAAIPAKRQTMLFSATMPAEIASLTKNFLTDPVKVSVTPQSTSVEKIEQRVMFVDREQKRDLLEALLEDETIYRVLVFTRTKHGANRIAKILTKKKIPTEALHGNKSQSARMLALNKFRSGSVRVLVATDIAARGLDVEGITHVINFELPMEAESYVHRIGRTARAGAEGIAISFCDSGERGYLRRIEQTIKKKLTVDEDQPFHSVKIATAKGRSRSGGYNGNGRGKSRGAGGSSGGGKKRYGHSAKPGSRAAKKPSRSGSTRFNKSNPRKSQTA
jgi:ATP-dependent RNA helicase RhlE